ncbi:MAG: proton-conducting transporter membrane subunit [Halanaerobiaceae bacterium]
MSTYLVLLAKFFSFNGINLPVAGTGLIVVLVTAVAAWREVRYRGLYFLLLMVFGFSFLLTVLAGNWLLFVVGWELVTLTTSILLLWDDRRAALQYFVLQFIGSTLLLYVVLLAMSRGYSVPASVGETWLQNLFVLGLGMKSAFLGFHFWLPAIYSRASTRFGALSSGLVAKLGFVMLLRLIPGENLLLFYGGLVMIFYGGIRALRSSDFKIFLAYSSISQLGYIALATGSGGVVARTGATVFIVAHALAKPGLFLAGESWIKDKGETCFFRFRVDFVSHFFEIFTVIVSLASMAGIPFLLGYTGKVLVKKAAGDGLLLSLLLYGTGLLTVMYSLRFLVTLLRGKDNAASGITGATGFYLLVLPLGIIGGGIMSVLPGWLPGLELPAVDPGSGLLEAGVYITLAWFLLGQLDWLRLPEREEPSLDKMVMQVYKFVYRFCRWFRRFDTEIFFENFIYRRLKGLARCLHDILYARFQTQLLWIPLFLIFLLVWVTFAV